MILKVIGFWGGYPKAGEASSCYFLQAGEKNILLEIGSGSLSILQKYIDINFIDAVIISHYHPDHFSDIFCLQHQVLIDKQLGKRNKDLTIYAPKHSFYIDELSSFPYTTIQCIDETSNIKIGDICFKFAKTKHIVDSLAIKATRNNKVLVYTSDTEYTESLRAFAMNCDVLLGECSLYDDVSIDIKGHMRAKDLGKLAKDCGTNSLIATHLPVYGDTNQLVSSIKRQYNGNILLAHEGLEINV